MYEIFLGVVDRLWKWYRKLAVGVAHLNFSTIFPGFSRGWLERDDASVFLPVSYLRRNEQGGEGGWRTRPRVILQRTKEPALASRSTEKVYRDLELEI